MITLPFDDSAAFTEEVTLDDAVYVFNFAWNFRGGYWLMSLYTPDELPILEGVKIALNENLFSGHPEAELPSGQLWAAAASDSTARISRNDLAVGDVELVYVPEAELASL
jgi:hypothetical protein